MQYISLIITGLLLLTIVASVVIAFIVRRNWASITMLVSIFLFILFIVAQIYLQRQMYERAISNDTGIHESRQNIRDAINYIGLFTIPLFMVGLTGFIKSTASIYQKATLLQNENQQLSIKLNQL